MATACMFWLVFLYWTLPAHVDSPPVPEKISTPFKLELPCQAPEGEVVILEWKLKGKDRYVLLYRDGKVRHNDQNPFFSNRVELKDSHLKSGDLSVILKNITSMDSGMYTCEAKISSHEKKKISHEMNVTVTEADELFVNQSGVVELPCSSPGGATVHDLNWTLQDQEGKEHHLLHFRDGKVIYQDPYWSNRVKLRDPELKSGDLTMKLLKVTKENSGTYICVAQSHSSDRIKVFMHLIRLTVNPEMKPSQKGAHQIFMYFALGGVIIITIFAFVCSKKRKICKCATSTENGSDLEGPSQNRRESKDILLGSHEAEGNGKFKEISQKKRGAPSNFSAGWAAYEDVTAFPRK